MVVTSTHSLRLGETATASNQSLASWAIRLQLELYVLLAYNTLGRREGWYFVLLDPFARAEVVCAIPGRILRTPGFGGAILTVLPAAVAGPVVVPFCVMAPARCIASVVPRTAVPGVGHKLLRSAIRRVISAGPDAGEAWTGAHVGVLVVAHGCTTAIHDERFTASLAADSQ
jgi:hypothetical protein